MILARAVQADKDPRVFGLQSYQGNSVTESGPDAWQAQIAFLAPAHRHVAVVTGETFVYDGTRGWRIADGEYTLIDLADWGGPATGWIGLPFPLAGAQPQLVGRDQVAGRTAYVLDLTRGPDAPTPTPKQNIFPHARIWFDSQTYIPLKIEDYDSGPLPMMTWRLTSFTANPPLDPALFTFAPPVNAGVETERTPTADEVDAIWAQAVAQAGYAVFRPQTLPAWLNPIPIGLPSWAVDNHGWVTAQYVPSTPINDPLGFVTSLVIVELPMPAGGVGNGGEALTVDGFPARYEERPHSRWLVLDREGTEIWLEGMERVSRDDLLATAHALTRVAPPAVLPPLLPPTGYLTFGSLSFVDAHHGWDLGNCQGTICARPLVATTDGGQTWQPRHAPPPGTTRIAFAGQANGWTAGAGLFVTHDGGQSWAAGGLPGEIVQVAPVGDSVWVLTQTCRPDPPTMGAACIVTFHVSADGGRTWQPGPDLGQAPSAQLIRVSKDAAWLSVGGPDRPDGPGADRLLLTRDGGQTWRPLPALPPLPLGEGGTLAGYADGHLWLLAEGPPATDMQDKELYQSADWGAHWQLIATTYAGAKALPVIGYSAALATTGAQSAWMSLARGGVYGTTDGGRTWHLANLPGDADPFDGGSGDVVFADAKDGWVGAARYLYRTTDGGAHWVALPPPSP